MNIKGKRLIIRAIESEDLPLLHSWFNDQELARGLGDIRFPVSLYQQQQWFELIKKDENTLRLIVQHNNGTVIGYTGFWNIHWRDRRAEHAVIIGDPLYRGKKYGEEIILSCARYAFNDMDFYRLDANILETNEASLKAYQACGFKNEGVLREHAFRDGKRINRILLGLLKSDYLAFIKKSEYWNKKQG